MAHFEITVTAESEEEYEELVAQVTDGAASGGYTVESSDAVERKVVITKTIML